MEAYNTRQKYQVKRTKTTKKQYPNWKRLGKKLKKEIARKVLAEAETKYDFEQAIDAQGGASWHRRTTPTGDHQA